MHLSNCRISLNLRLRSRRLTRAILVFGWVLLLPSMVKASDRLDYSLLKSVVRIQTAPTVNGPEVGCGFLVGGDPTKGGRVFLITNKHMIGDWNIADGDIQNAYPWVDVFFYRTV